MSDFIIIIDPEFEDASEVEMKLKNRPTMFDRPVSTWKFPWGSVFAQEPRSAGYSPFYREGNLTFCMGRPRFTGHSLDSCDSTHFSYLMSQTLYSDELVSKYSILTGCFVIAHVTCERIIILTDRLGSYPVYECLAPNSRRRVIGTHPELVAYYAARYSDWDSISLAEIVIRQAVTFPFTSRNGMSELAPGRLHHREVSQDGVRAISEKTLWLPKEPDVWPSNVESCEALVSALQFAGDDVTRGIGRVGVTLSAGIDSRTVLSVMPKDKISKAYTFCDHENWETRTAESVAKKANIAHQLVFRAQELYADLAVLETRLIGSERGNVNAHTMALENVDISKECDVVVCGWLSDTLLKGYYMSPVLHEISVRGIRNPSPHESMGGKWVSECVKAELLPLVVERWRNRFEYVRTLRPLSAYEWTSFYPISRQCSFSYGAASQRIMASELLFLHKDVIEIAVTAHPTSKKKNMMATPVFASLCGDLGRIPVSGTRVPIIPPTAFQSLYFLPKRIARRVRRSLPMIRNRDGWFTDHSWVNYRRLQEQSRKWGQIRGALQPNECDALCGVLIPELEDFARGYQSRFLAETNYTIIKLMLVMNEYSKIGGAIALPKDQVIQ